MIEDFSDADTRVLFENESNRRFAFIARVTIRKLIQMNRASRLEDLAVPPGNRLEALKGDLSGFHSIRVNGQWRIVFCWTPQGPAQVRIVDYH
jgi:proteic killer suppression protein